MMEQFQKKETSLNPAYEQLILSLSRKARSLENKDNITEKKHILEYLGAAFYNAEFRKNFFKTLPDFFQEFSETSSSKKQEASYLLFKKTILKACIIAEAHQEFQKNRGYSLLDVEDHIRRLCPTKNEEQKAFLDHAIFQAIDDLAALPAHEEMSGHLEGERIKIMDRMLEQQKQKKEFQPCPRNEKKISGSPNPEESLDRWHDMVDAYKKPLDQFLDRMSGLAERLHQEERTDLFAHVWVEKVGEEKNPQYVLKTFGLAMHPPTEKGAIGFDRTPVEMTIVLSPAEAYELLRLQQIGANAQEFVKKKAETLFLEKTFSSKATIESWNTWRERSETRGVDGLPATHDQPLHLMIHGWGGIPFVWDEQIEETIKNLAQLKDPSLQNQIWCSFGLQGALSTTPDYLFAEDGSFDRTKLKNLEEDHLFAQPVQAFTEMARQLHRIHHRTESVRDADGALVSTKVFSHNEYPVEDMFAWQQLVQETDGFFISAGKVDFSLEEAALFKETLKDHASIVGPTVEKIKEQLHSLDFDIFVFFQEIYNFPLEKIRAQSPLFKTIEQWRMEYIKNPDKAIQRERLEILVQEIARITLFDKNPDFTALFHEEFQLLKKDIRESKREVSARKILEKLRQSQVVSNEELQEASDTISYYYQSNDSDFSVRLFQVLRDKKEGKPLQGRALRLWETLSTYLDREPPMKRVFQNKVERIFEESGIFLTVDIDKEIDQLWETLLADEQLSEGLEEDLEKNILGKIQEKLEKYKIEKSAEFIGSPEKSLNIWGERTKPLEKLLRAQKLSLNKTEEYWQENLERILFERTTTTESDCTLFAIFKEKYPEEAHDPAFLRAKRPELGYRIDQLRNLAKLAGWDDQDYNLSDEDFLQNLFIKHLLSEKLGETRLLSLAEISMKQHLLAGLAEVFGHSMGGKIARALARGLRPDSAIKPSPLARLYKELNVSPSNVQFIASNEVIHGSRLTPEEEAKASEWLGEQRKDMVILHSRQVGGFLVQGKSILTNPLIGVIGETFGIERGVLLWYLGAMKSATPLVMHEYVYQQKDQIQQQIGSWLLRNMPFFIHNDITLDEDRWLAGRGIVIPQIGMDDNILWPGDGVVGNRIINPGNNSASISAGLNHYPEADEIGRALAVLRALRGRPETAGQLKDTTTNWADLRESGWPDRGISPEEMQILFPRISDLVPKDTRSGIPSPEIILAEIKKRIPRKKIKEA